MHLRQFKRLSCHFVLALSLLCAVGGERAHAQRKTARRASGTTRTQQGATTETETRTSPFVTEGLRLADEGKWAEAVKAYKHALVDNPKDVEAYMNMGDAYLNMGNDKEALAAYREAVRLAPNSADTNYALGAALNVAGQNSDAFKPLVRAIQLDPNYAEAYYGIGYAYQQLENYKDAIGFLRSAIRLKPDYADAHLALGLAYAGLGELKAAEAQLKTLQTLDATLAPELDKAIRKLAATSASVNERATPSNQPAPAPRESTQKNTQGNAAQRPANANAAAQKSAPTASEGLLLAVELNFWNSIKDSNDPEEFAAYIKKYPNGQFIELAKIRLRALENKKSATAQTEAAGQTEAPPPPAAPVTTPATTTATPTPTPTPVATPAATLVETLTSSGAKEQPKPAQEQAAQTEAQPVASPSPVERPAEPESPTTLEETVDWIGRYFPSKFTYQVTTPGDGAGAAPVMRTTMVDVELLRFDSCYLEWRDGADRLAVALADLDPQSVKVEVRQKPETTFSIEVWQVSLTANGGQGAFRETKGDGGAERRYNGVDLQYSNQATAQKLARALQKAIKLCGGKPANN